MFFHMPQALTAARKRILEDDVFVLCGISGYVVDAMCNDALASVGTIGMIGMDGVEQKVGRLSLRACSQCSECGIGGELRFGYAHT